MKYIITILLLISISFFWFTIQKNNTFPQKTNDFNTKNKNIISLPAKVSPPALSLKGKYTCLMDAKSGRVLYSQAADKPVPMASTTKIMTCLIALETGRLTDIVTITKNAASQPKVHLGMKAGESYYLKDLLYSLMLCSHNDSAVAIAEHIGGSVKGFAKRMNEKAKAIGLTHTSFVTPNGLDAPNHLTTAIELCRIARIAKQNTTFNSIISTPAYTLQEIRTGRSISLRNKDSFLSIYDGASGIKTGFTNKAGYCFVGSATRNNISLISATLASGWPPNKSYKWQDTIRMMDYGFHHYRPVPLPCAPITNLSFPVKGGLKSTVSLQKFTLPSVLISDFDSLKIHYNIPSIIKAPIQKNSPLGSISYYINHSLVAKIPLYPSHDIQEATFLTYFFKIIRIWA